LNIDIDKHQDKISEIVQTLKEKENQGYQYEAAEGSLKLLIRKITDEYQEFFTLKGFRILIEKDENGEVRSEATVRMDVDGEFEHSAAEGNGPVNALDMALRKALTKFYPKIKKMKLADYKVRVLDAKDATGEKERVLIDSTNSAGSWGTVGVSENIIEASWEALTESISYYLHKT
jgi:2-isopropylmalate synthase